MNGKKNVTLRFTLSAESIGNENATHSTIGTFIMPLNASDDEPLYSVHLPGDRLGKANTLAARIACQALDVALKRHLERGGGSDTPELLTDLHIDPMGDIRNARP